MVENNNNSKKKFEKKNNSLAILLSGIIIAMSLLVSSGGIDTTASYLVGASNNATVIVEIDNETVPNVNVLNDFELDIAQGRFSNIASNFKFGRNTDIGVNEEVIWDLGGDYTFLNTAERLNISSNNILDNGYLQLDGAWDLVIYGLDENYTEIIEYIVLNGTTPVTTTQSFLRTYRAHILKSGLATAIDNANEGDILIETFSGIDQAGILQHNGQTLMAAFTTPANKTGYITGVSAFAGEGKSIFLKGKVRNCNTNNCSFSVKYTLDLYQNNFFGDLVVPLRVPEKTDMVFTGQSSSPAGVDSAAAFGIIIIDN